MSLLRTVHSIELLHRRLDETLDASICTLEAASTPENHLESVSARIKFNLIVERQNEILTRESDQNIAPSRRHGETVLKFYNSFVGHRSLAPISIQTLRKAAEDAFFTCEQFQRQATNYPISTAGE